METTDLLVKAEFYKKLIQDARKQARTAKNKGFWRKRVTEMEQVQHLIDLNLSLRNAWQQIKENAAPGQEMQHF